MELAKQQPQQRRRIGLSHTQIGVARAERDDDRVTGDIDLQRRDKVVSQYSLQGEDGRGQEEMR